MPPVRVAVAFVVSTVLVALAPTLRAAPRTFVVLDYEIAPEATGCPSVEEFRASVERQLGYDAFKSDAERRVAVAISAQDGGFKGFIRWTDARGHWAGDRRLSSQHADCSEIAKNTAFAVAVQIQLLSALEPGTTPAAAASSTPASTSTSSTSNGTTPGASGTSPSTAPPATATATATAPTPKPPSPPAAAGRENTAPAEHAPSGRAAFGLSAGLGASLGLAVAPHPTGIGRLFVSGRVAWFSLELGADAAIPVSHTEADGSGFWLDRFAGEAAACGHVRGFAACVTSAFGVLQARGFGVDKPASPAGFFSQLGARIAWTQDFGPRYFLTARAEALVLPSPWSVTLDGTTVWTTPRVGGLGGLDFGVNIF